MSTGEHYVLDLSDISFSIKPCLCVLISTLKFGGPYWEGVEIARTTLNTARRSTNEIHPV